ncbi:MAG TPA: methionine aminotransferase [Bacteroidales bacterium]
MIPYQGKVYSKLPQTGTSIFAVMSAMATKYNAVNLSQGFPDFPISKELISLVNGYMKKGFNQYAPMPGVPSLREGISNMFFEKYKAKYDKDSEITITAGATQALFAAISAFVGKEDEVIIFEPAYDSYAPAIKLNGGIVKYISLNFPDFSIDWAAVKQRVTNRTRMIIINSPQNPTGSVLKENDLKELERLTKGTDIIVMSDEVYEHLIFNEIKHQSVCRFPDLASRSLLIGSFGKTFHATGWKVGFVLAPEKLTKEFRKVHQFNVFAVNTPIQYAIGEFIQDKNNYESLGNFYQEKRDFFVNSIKNSRFKVLPCYGTYFQLLDYSDISEEKEMEFASRLCSEHGLAAIPVSSFYNRGNDNKVLRFCFAKQESTLKQAAEILCKI